MFCIKAWTIYIPLFLIIIIRILAKAYCLTSLFFLKRLSFKEDFGEKKQSGDELEQAQPRLGLRCQQAIQWKIKLEV